MKDHLKVIRSRLVDVEKEETARLREAAEMRYAGATLVNYLFAIANDIKVSEGERAKIKRAIQLFGRSR